MVQDELLQNNPVKLMGHTEEDFLEPGEIGAVIGRAGIGKTAVLIHLALGKLLRDLPVLHISLKDPVKKVCLQYEQIFAGIRTQSGGPDARRAWESLLPKRFIMTLRVEGFGIPAVQERLEDLMAQDIFKPDWVVLDGLEGSMDVNADLTALKNFAVETGLRVWTTLSIPYEEGSAAESDTDQPRNQSALVAPNLLERLDEILLLQPRDKHITIDSLIKKPQTDTDARVYFDPVTMVVAG